MRAAALVTGARLPFIAKGTLSDSQPRSAPIPDSVVSVDVTEFDTAQVEAPDTADNDAAFDMGRADAPAFLDGPLVGLDKDDGSLLERRFMAEKNVEQVVIS